MTDRSVVFLLPGQGAQADGMARALHGVDPTFTDTVDEVFDALGAHGARLRADWLSTTPELPVDHVLRSQPLLFAIDLAYARVALGWGVRPAVLLGHSAGETVAAVLAGVFDLRAAAQLMWQRMSRLVDAPAGGMLAVSAPAGELAGYLRDDVTVAAVNAPRQTVLAGSRASLGDVGATLRDAGFTTSPVASLTPFHSPALAAFTADDADGFRALAVRPPAVPIRSCYTGRTLTGPEAADPHYWAAHPTAPVQFWPALAGLLDDDGDRLLLETGPGQGLTRIARRHKAVRSGRSVAVPMSPARPGGELAALDTARSAVRDALASGPSTPPPPRSRP